MTSHTKEIVHESVHRQEAWRMSGGFEPAHLSLALSSRLMRAFRSIVLVSRRAVHHRGHDRALGRGVAAELVRDQTARGAALSFQQFSEETFGRPLIAPGLHEDVDHVAVLVDRSPAILLTPLDVHEQFAQVPRVTHAAALAPERPGVRRTECPTPLPNGLVRNGDALLCQEIFGVSETQTRAVVDPEGVADDQRGKPLSLSPK